MTDAWYKPSEIRFWPEHVRFLLEHLIELENGRWPRNPKETGYTDAPGPLRFHNAYFETPVCFAAEITARLIKCGKDGTLTRKCLSEGWDEQSLAELLNSDIYRIRRRVNRVVYYCSGWRRRKITYMEFVTHRRSKVRK